jgi:putative salt-induced outer membrane protein
MRLTRLPLHSGLLLIFIFCAGLAAAQTPAPGPAPATPPPPPRLDVSGQFSFLDTQGNASSQSLGAGGEVNWRPDPWIYSAKAAFAQTKSDDELSARSLTTLFRATRLLTPRLALFGQYDFLRDLFAGVEQRHIIQGGVSYLAYDAHRQRLRLDAGLGYLHERDVNDSRDTATIPLGAAYHIDISKTSEFNYEPRFLLTLADAGAWKFDQQVSLTAALNSILSVKLSHTLRYSARPPVGFKSTDTISAVSLVAKFSRAQ